MPTVARRLRINKKRRSRVWDYRAGTRPNGGRIQLRACVHHIPVMHNQKGRKDLDSLRRVLIDQGLMVQFGTDEEANVALYTRANRLCYHAKGGNHVTCGIEHMKFRTSEDWERAQMKAAAWIAQYLKREFDIPFQMADVERGPGNTVVIRRKGHTSHQQISRMAGYNDRTDPGPGFDYELMFKLARYFERKGHFVGA